MVPLRPKRTFCPRWSYRSANAELALNGLLRFGTALCTIAHSAELDYAGGDDLPELLPREAAQAPAPRGFARPGDLSAGGGVV